MMEYSILSENGIGVSERGKKAAWKHGMLKHALKTMT